MNPVSHTRRFLSLSQILPVGVNVFGGPSLAKHLFKTQCDQTWRWTASLISLGIGALAIGNKKISLAKSCLISLAVSSIAQAIAYYVFPQPIVSTPPAPHVLRSILALQGKWTTLNQELSEREVGSKIKALLNSDLRGSWEARPQNSDAQGMSFKSPDQKLTIWMGNPNRQILRASLKQPLWLANPEFEILAWNA